MNRNEMRLKATIFNYFIKYFTPQEINDILDEMKNYFNSHEAHNLYNLIHNN